MQGPSRTGSVTNTALGKSGNVWDDLPTHSSGGYTSLMYLTACGSACPCGELAERMGRTEHG